MTGLFLVCASISFLAGRLTTRLEKLERKMTAKIREKSESKYTEMNKSITTVSSGTIVVIFSLLKLFDFSKDKTLIISSLWLLITAIILGAIGQFVIYFHTKLEGVVFAQFERSEKSDRKKKLPRDFGWIFNWFSKSGLVMAFLPILQLLSFVAAFVLIAFFVSWNI